MTVKRDFDEVRRESEEEMRVFHATESPRPWRINEVFFVQTDWGPDHSPILDAHGRGVIAPSEWLKMRRADVELIVKAVNASC